ncbi:MAG: hypothetical protein K2X27_19295 [Candidatus Obscuribacterales bacterium]|nr:hypothetical protein [Candidatus Obscuribacterales bacterium]
MSTSSLYGSAAAPEVRGALDSSKSASQLVQDGTFIQSNRAPRLDQNDRAAGEQPKITVTTDNTVTPDYIVRQDGKVEVVGNPDAGAKANGNYRIQVEPGASQQATDDLVKYLGDRIQQKDPSAQVSLEAAPGLVSESIASRFNKNSPENPENTPEDQNPPDDSPSDPGGGGGGGGGCPNSPSDTSPDNSPQDTPQDTPNETNPPSDVPSTVLAGPMDNIVDAARLNTWDNPTNGAIGAYEINSVGWFSSWLDEEMMAELGNPPDYRKLGKVLAKHKNNPKFKARLDNMREQGDSKGAEKIEGLFNRLSDEKESAFAENFGIFLNGQKEGGRNATGEEMINFMDKDLQRAIASSRMCDIAHEAGVKIKDLSPEMSAKMALSGALGHVPNEKEMSDYNKYLQVVASRFKPARTELAQK